MKVRKIFLICLMVCAALCTTVAFTACDGVEGGDTYTVSYERGAEDATGTIPETKSYAEGAKVTLAAKTTFTREGWEFKNWSDGEKTYNAGAEFTMPAKNVKFTAMWEEEGKNPPIGEKDEPTLTELASKFYTASNWQYMTNNDGASLDGGDIPYSLNDGSIKFHRLNQAIEMGDLTNSTVSFMLKGTNDWSIWFNSSSIDNSNNSSYRLAYAYGGLRLVVSSAPDQAAAVIENSSYEKGKWNRFDVVFSTTDKVCRIKVYVNGERATLAAGDNVTPQISVADNVLTHTAPAMFTTGNYMCVKVWEAHNYVQIKPVAKADEKDVPIIACIGASITEGAGAGNFYTESYPAQLQNALGGAYNVVNFGKSGRTVRTDTGVDDDKVPVPWLENNQWTGVQAIVPDIAILNIGTNDSKSNLNPLSTHDSFKAAYEHLLDEILKVNTEMQIYICTVPCAYKSPYGISNDNIRDIIAPVQREIAQENEYTLIDLYTITQNKSLLFGDGVHPNTTGYAMFVEVISKVLQEGAEGLTQDFLDYINEKYNDPEYELTNIHGSIAVSGDAINLTVTGNLQMEDTSKLRLVVETGTSGEEKEVAMTPGANGDFSGTINLAELTSTKWYNVRVYITETFYEMVYLDDTEYSVGGTFHTDSRRVIVRSWKSGEKDTFSFSVSGYNTLSLTSAAIADGVLTLSGTTDDSGIRLYIGADPSDNSKYNEYKNITVGQDGSFTATFDLSELPVGGWYNARLYFTDGSYYPLSYNQISYNGGTLAKGDILYFETTKATIESWNDESTPTLSFAVAANDGSGDIKLTAVSIEKSGNAINLTIAGKALGISSSVYEKALLYIGSGTLTYQNYESLCTPMTETTAGEFSVTYDLAQLEVGDGYQIRIYRLLKNNTVKGYYTLKFEEVSVNNGDVLSTDEKELTFATQTDWAPVEIKVREVGSVELSATLTSQTVTMSDGKIYLNVSGTTNDAQLKLVADDGKGHSSEQAATVSGGSFNASLDISALEAIGDWYFAKLVYSDNTSLDLKRSEVLFGGYALVPWVNGVSANDSKLYANNKVIKPQNSDNFAFTVSSESGKKATVTSIIMENGKYIATVATMNAPLTGAGLYKFSDSTVGDGFAGTVTGQDGYYTVEVDLNSFSASGDWYFLALNLDNGGLAKADFPAHFANTVKYGYNGLVFTTKYSWATAIHVGTFTNVMISSVSFDNDQLVIRGGVASTVTKLQLYLNNTNIKGDGITSGKLYENTNVTIEADKTFSLRIDLSNFAEYNIKSNALNLRMLINESTEEVTANTDINLSATYEYSGKTYAFKTQNGTIALTAK